MVLVCVCFVESNSLKNVHTVSINITHTHTVRYLYAGLRRFCFPFEAACRVRPSAVSCDQSTAESSAKRLKQLVVQSNALNTQSQQLCS